MLHAFLRFSLVVPLAFATLSLTGCTEEQNTVNAPVEMTPEELAEEGGSADERASDY